MVLLSAYGLLRASLPQLEGTRAVPGLAAAVAIERDAFGVPTLHASTREDLAYATGFLHAQERFFQMDLQRRVAAGELAELVGGAALPHDRRLRAFRFREVARQSLTHFDAAHRVLLEAYARGVNAGLDALGGRPWEYWLLRSPPAPWRAEDSLLVVHAMWWDLQGGDIARQRLRHAIDARLGGPVCADGWRCALHFFYPQRTAWDAPTDLDAAGAASDAAQHQAPIPGPEVIDLRNGKRAPPVSAALPRRPLQAIGSNGSVVGGAHTASGAALVASDMHLAQRVPIIWYRMRLQMPARAGTAALDITGVTLPGAPLVVAGSNGSIAWGFTNSYGSWMDLHVAPCLAPDAAAASERIHVHGGADQLLAVRSGAQGLELGPTREGRCAFLQWLALNPEATNFGLIGLEQARSAAEAVGLAPQIGIPHQNLVVGDRDGHIGWTIAGLMPGAAVHPQLLDPPLGRIWTANARVISSPEAEQAIGGRDAQLGATYDLGARASQIRDDLLGLDHPATPADLLAVQLDDRALFLDRWRELALAQLDSGALHEGAARRRLLEVLGEWSGHAGTDSAAYRVVRDFHDRAREAVWRGLLAGIGIDDPGPTGPPAQFEQPLWQLLQGRPAHLLAPPFTDWHAFLLAQLDATQAALERECGELRSCTWGRRNTVAIRHPLSAALPGAARWLDMPVLQLPGDADMPRVQNGEEGASERFAVSPGHEGEGYFHMPGGQSGHPLSPYYRAGFMAWAHGEPLPFLPGIPVHALRLEPAAAGR